MPVIVNNGKRVGADYRTVINNNGAIFASSNGKRLSSLNRWGGMTWNGHHFAPPDSGSVLYLPGIPGVGSTIFDFSNSFSDSGINTAEALDNSETAIDVSADPTSAYSTGDVIRIDDEFMYVTSSAEPTLVTRGWDGSHAVSHDNTKDIYVRTKNDGAITGALWKQLPSGLWYLDFDGTDDYVAIGSNLTKALSALTVMAWVNPTDRSGPHTIMGDYTDETDVSFFINIADVDATSTWQLELAVNGDGAGGINRTLGTVTTRPYGTWAFIGGVWDGSSNLLYVNGDVDGSEANSDAQTEATVTLNTTIGAHAPGSDKQNTLGGIALSRIFTTTLTPNQIAEIYNQERHLFGV